MTDAPHRKHRLCLSLEADSMDDLAVALHQIALDVDLEQIGETAFRTSGGVRSGYTVAVLTDQDQSHERFFEMVKLWLAERKTGTS